MNANFAVRDGKDDDEEENKFRNYGRSGYNKLVSRYLGSPAPNNPSRDDKDDEEEQK